MVTIGNLPSNVRGVNRRAIEWSLVEADSGFTALDKGRCVYHTLRQICQSSGISDLLIRGLDLGVHGNNAVHVNRGFNDLHV